MVSSPRTFHGRIVLRIFPALVFFATAAVGAESDFTEALAAVHASSADLNVRPDRWPTRMTLRPIENLLSDPIRLPETASDQAAAARQAKGGAGLLRVCEQALDLESASSEGPPEAISLAPKSGVPPELREILETLAVDIGRARAGMDQAAAALAPAERRRLLRSFAPLLTYQGAAPPDGAAYALAEKFDVGLALSSARKIAAAVEAALPGLANLSAKTQSLPRTRWETSSGAVVVSGVADETFDAADLDGVALLVHFGRKTRYVAAPAAAGPGQIRVVVDRSADLAVESTGAASGVFGIGLLYLPFGQGRKTLRGGDVSLGAGLFGVGGLFVAGTVDLDGGAFTEGAGAFGAGILDSAGDGSTMTARLAGQGLGFTRGAGIFRHYGDGGRFDCGLTVPDPHESQAAVSLCQGMGWGPRAFAAGGVGIAVLDANHSSFKSNYNSQGSGYWHGFGILSIQGDGNVLQARRYGQGSGVHTALGALIVRGDGNRTLNWGVGPSFGWDYGVGSFETRGNDNVFFATWGTGRGDANGRSLALIQGDRNKLFLPDFGSAYPRRLAPSYGLAVCRGRDNKIRDASFQTPFHGPVSLRSTAWGVLAGDAGLTLDPTLTAPEAQWPEVERASQTQEERGRLAGLLRAADQKQGVQRLDAWLSVIESAELDWEIPLQAAARLLSVSTQEAQELPELISDERFDSMIWLRTVLAAFGDSSFQAIDSAQRRASGIRKALLLGQLAYVPAARAIEPALAALRDPDRRVRRQAAALLGALFNQEGGDIPGRLRMLRNVRGLCGRPASKGPLSAEEAGPLGQAALPDFYGVMALVPGISVQERVTFLAHTPNPFDILGPESWNEFSRLLSGHADACSAALDREIRSSEDLAPRAHEAVLGMLGDSDPGVRAAAYAVLGQLGRGQDAKAIATGLEESEAEVREAASMGLSKLGPGGAVEIRTALRQGGRRTRAMAALAASQSWDEEAFDLVRSAFKDSAADVRQTALAGLATVPYPNRTRRKELLPELERMASGDPSPDVQAEARLAESWCR